MFSFKNKYYQINNFFPNSKNRSNIYLFFFEFKINNGGINCLQDK